MTTITLTWKRTLQTLAVAAWSLSAALAQSSAATAVQVDATQTLGRLEPFWASQIVHPTEFLLTEWGQRYVRLLKATGAARQYIRIYNQPENAVRVMPDGTITYDWSRFDAMADVVLSSGNKLKVVFFSMPVALALHPKELYIRESIGAVCCISPPKDYKQWEELCRNFTRHVIEKYGIDEVKQWLFRCWNEPDYGYWYNKDLPEYLKLYDHFAQGVKSVSPDVKIGGPALTSIDTYKKPENFRFFLEHVANGVNHATGKVGSPIDYIAVHTYGGSGARGGPGRSSPAMEFMIEQQLRYADMRDEFPALRHLPIHVDEWGVASGGYFLDPKLYTPVRDSEYNAAFLTAWVERHVRMRLEKDRKIEGFTFCALNDYLWLGDFNGFRTLITKNGFHKPILNAYKLLARLAPDLVAVSLEPANRHIYSFASRDAERITVVVTNYQEERVLNDGDSHPVRLEVKTPWPNGTRVSVSHWRIDRTHSNAYTVFKEIGSPKQPSAGQVDAVKKRMELELLRPAQTMPVAELSGMEWSLPCNGISLVEIVKRE